ncbi:MULTISPECIES: ExbD/TolR family protein [Spirosoma]|uniref:Biopolymer transporter ExbD n=1 Tax=Spirosoma liriopis TaxID=2937440 RepID=A0ABT0HHG0_9BACT|nr:MULTISPECIES: biopolymer transporter ExbD [Spirosoma]MCK8491589.1 biopolymer transporter ExbD [Spirosoma liriopis]UHG90951.1 biopolymer transporter ExbD [Spirosoma oryzicola]
MAEINTGGGGGKHDGGKVRSKKASTRVDMTPMVDLGFLLITFFILATTLSKPSSMTLNVPDKTKTEETEPIKASNVMTIFLGKDNKAHYIFGKAANEDPEVKTVSYGYDFRQAIQENARKVAADKFVVVIKPTKLSTYKNMVDVLDEMAITKTKRYALVDQLTPDEKKMLKDKVKIDV